MAKRPIKHDPEDYHKIVPKGKKLPNIRPIGTHSRTHAWKQQKVLEMLKRTGGAYTQRQAAEEFTTKFQRETGIKRVFTEQEIRQPLIALVKQLKVARFTTELPDQNGYPKERIVYQEKQALIDTYGEDAWQEYVQEVTKKGYNPAENTRTH